jgi:hypothetical protein
LRKTNPVRTSGDDSQLKARPQPQKLKLLPIKGVGSARICPGVHLDRKKGVAGETIQEPGVGLWDERGKAIGPGRANLWLAVHQVSSPSH